MNIGEKVAYLKGLAEGIEISSDTKEGKLLTGILDILGDISDALKELEEEEKNLSIYAEELDEDLGALEKAFVKNYDFDSFDYSDKDFADDLYNEDDEDYEDFGDLEGSAKVNCPSCGELILFDAEDIETEGSFTCPECGVEISVVGAFSSDGCGCGHCHGHSHDDADEEPEEEADKE